MTRPVLFYAFAKFGLGHSARSATIAATAARLGVPAILVHDQPALPMPSNIVSILMPNWQLKSQFESKHRPTHDDLLPPNGYTASDLSAARLAIFMDAVKTHRPQAIYVDHFPFNVRKVDHEITPVLEFARKLGARIVCGFRGVLSMDEARDSQHERKVLDSLEAFADALIIFLPSALSDLAPSLLQHAALPIHFVGFIAPLRQPRPFNDIAADVIAAVGGGADAAHQVRCIINCAGLTPEITYQLALGPHFRGCHETEFRPALPSNLQAQSFLSELPSRISSSKLYVGMSGYNTLMAVIAANKRCILLPREGAGIGEQCIWAALMTRLGLAQNVFTPPYDIAAVSACIRSALKLKPPSIDPLIAEMNGAAKAVEELSS